MVNLMFSNLGLDKLRDSLGHQRLFSKQVIIGHKAVCPDPDWMNAGLGGDLTLSYHPSTDVSRRTEGSITVTCIGHPFLPAEPAMGNQAIARWLAQQCGHFEQLEDALAELAGRWLIVAVVNGASRVYLDAAGTRSLFYMKRTNSSLIAASSPALLAMHAGLALDVDVLRHCYEQKWTDGWYGQNTPYEGCRQLLPNFFLDVRSREAKRYWPRQPIAAVPTNEAAARIAAMLEGTINAAAARRPLYMGLTGGYDSRVLMGCAGERRRDIHYFTIRRKPSSKDDVDKAILLAKRFSLSHTVVNQAKTRDKNERLVTTLTVGGLQWDFVNDLLQSWKFIPVDAFELVGNVAEVLRCYYDQSRFGANEIDAHALCRICHVPPSDLALQSFMSWLDSVPHDAGVDLLDLFYWEHRIGAWGALGWGAYDAYVERVLPFNCKKLLEIGLGVNRKDRAPPFDLFREILRVRHPDQLSIPFNKRSLVERLQSRGLMEMRQRLKRLAALARVSNKKSMPAGRDALEALCRLF